MSDAGARTRVDVRILDPRIADRLPSYATSGSAGLDLRACIDAPLVLAPGASTSGASMQARRSRPALPTVA